MWSVKTDIYLIRTEWTKIHSFCIKLYPMDTKVQVNTLTLNLRILWLDVRAAPGKSHLYEFPSAR
jgi:hypothetical protein